MEFATISLIALFAISMVGSPGPANMALMASGASYGFRASIPFLAGTISGFMLVGISVAAGLGSLFRLYPTLQTIFLYSSALYIIYLAWRIAFSDPANADNKSSPRYLLGLIVHPLNPKAWIMIISAFSQFIDVGTSYIVQATTILAIFLLVSVPLNSIWCFGGNLMNKLIKTPIALRALNASLALIMVVVVIWILIDSGLGTV
jgi:threonine/homoserine/homoserine lactone efflux protein